MTLGEQRRVWRLPELPAGFTGVFHSQYVQTGDVRLHAVIGGDGRPLLLIGGWPQTSYAWRRLMLPLARDYRVIAVGPVIPAGSGVATSRTSGRTPPWVTPMPPMPSLFINGS